MKHFIIKGLLFVFIAILAINMYGFYLLKTGKHIGLSENSQIYNAISKLFIPNKSTRVFIFGDSVANQMYYNKDYNGEINSFCTVMPITLAGQYLMIKQLCEQQDIKNKKVVLILSPVSFKSEIDNKASVHYLLKPFYNSSFYHLFDAYLKNTIDTPTLCSLTQLPMVKISNYYNKSGILPFFNKVTSPKRYKHFSQSTIHYLKMIKHLSIQEEFILQVVPSIQNIENPLNIKSFNIEVEQLGLYHILDEYTVNIKSWDANFFLNDKIHFRDHNSIPYNVLNL